MIKTYKFFGALFALLFFVFFGFGSYTVADSAFAGDFVTSYSNVLDDLGKDQDFDVDDYPVDVTDYTIDVVTIGESKDGELFIYTYQPCFTKNFRATCVSMSLSIGDDIIPRLYNLQFINKSGVLYKYKVIDFTISSSNVRYYEIYSVFRRYDSSIDDAPSDSSQTINEVSFPVKKRWAVDSSGGNYRMTETEVEVITVTDKFVGFVRYENGFRLYTQGACDSHFVAFSTDKPMDKLMEADVSYTHQEYEKTQTGSYPVETWGTIVEDLVTVRAESASHHGNGLGALTYEWARIETASDFMAHTENNTIYSGVLLDVSTGTTIDETAKQAIQSKQWVLRFAETSYTYSMSTTWTGTDHVLTTFVDKTLVGSVTILRLYFETSGVVYNLGVVDNKQTGSDKPINSGSHLDVDIKNPFDNFNPDDDWMKYVIAAVMVIFSILILVLIIKIVDKIPKKTKTVVSYSRPKKKKYKRGK